ncbi:hypothetical protein T440DRAFT_523687 [Plenodomus tracheiphilus IPT5]|uniref:F-box domain-containing protein n=1 Tax=Plenodomus tracheiphilus IPT5 TaxID=1408161 RepID=A0A6A7AMF1_9PLEO|nr:hypothetical protein T440DRAFT_523687 [Plenodomus tracheiphilus IPT5]
MTSIQKLPFEVLRQILGDVAEANTRDGATYTYGLSRASLPLSPTHSQRYVRGPLPPDQLRWDVSSVLRCVCRQWHDWALDYALRELYLRQWRGAERWVDLSPHRRLYPLYELVDRPTGTAVYRDPFAALRRTASICREFPGFGSAIRRVCVYGFYTAETVSLVYESLKECCSLTSLSCPWTAIRFLSRESWQMLLTGRRVRLESLELQCVEPTAQQIADKTNWIDVDPLRSVDFSCLHRLKIFGNTTHMPVTDSDVFTIASTTTGLREFHLTCNSSTTIDSVVAVAKAASATLRVLEHSPRSRDGFWHPHPGSPNGDSQHYCAMFRKLSRMETLSVSLPSICADFFSNDFNKFSGTLQVRAVHICEHESSRWTSGTVEALQLLLEKARIMIKRCSRDVTQRSLDVELFFAGYIFEPGAQTVHGDFSTLRRLSGDRWSPAAVASSKGPYGSTGLYEANEGVSFERIEEGDFLRANQWLYVL